MKKLDVVCSILVSVICIYLYYQDNPAGVWLLAIANPLYAVVAYIAEVKLTDFKKLTNFK